MSTKYEEMERKKLTGSFEIGDRLKECRESAGLTQGDLAKLAGISKNHLGYIEQGSRGLSEKMAEKLADALKVRPEYLLGLSEYQTESEITAVRTLGDKMHGPDEALCSYLNAMGYYYRFVPTNKDYWKDHNIRNDGQADFIIGKNGKLVCAMTNEIYDNLCYEIYDFAQYKIKQYIKNYQELKGEDDNGDNL